MAHRTLSAVPLGIHPDLQGQSIASPFRRLSAFALDVLLIVLPSIVVAALASALALRISDPAAYRAVKAFLESPGDRSVTVRSLGDLAPTLVRIQAPGLPPEVTVAVRDSDLQRAGEILSEYSFDISLSSDGDARGMPEPGHIRVPVERLIPGALRSATLFGVAGIYFTLLTWSRLAGTLGKRLLGLRVRKLDGHPFTLWDSFERFAGYFASLGTLGIGLVDFWRDPNRRLAHDRIAGTVVLRAGRTVKHQTSDPGAPTGEFETGT